MCDFAGRPAGLLVAGRILLHLGRTSMVGILSVAELLDPPTVMFARDIYPAQSITGSPRVLMFYATI